MQTREGLDFWGLLKNTNCAFPLNYVHFGSILDGFLSLHMTKLKTSNAFYREPDSIKKLCRVNKDVSKE